MREYQRRCKSIGPEPEQYRCGLPEGHGPHLHSALIPTGAPWFGIDEPQDDAQELEADHDDTE